MTENENRLYAANLLNRAHVEFDASDIAAVSKVLEILEDDVAFWLSSQLRGTVSREQIVAAVRAGSHRTGVALSDPAPASLQRKLK